MYGTPFIYYISLSIARFEAFTVAKSVATPEEAFIRAYCSSEPYQSEGSFPVKSAQPQSTSEMPLPSEPGR